jgi:excisionase family DNA binding protein
MKLNESRLLSDFKHRIILGECLEDTELTKALTVEQVAKELQLPETTIRKMFRKGTLPAVKLGKHWRMSEETLDKILRGEIAISADDDDGADADDTDDEKGE